MQDRNPGVPGIIYKICPENDDLRRLDQARNLWKATAEITGIPIKDIYTGKEIPLESLSIDHFVPRSFMSSFFSIIMSILLAFIASIILCFPGVSNFVRKHRKNPIMIGLMLLLFWISMFFAVTSQGNSFMYFNF